MSRRPPGQAEKLFWDAQRHEFGNDLQITRWCAEKLATTDTTSCQTRSFGDFNGDCKSDILWQNGNGTPAI